MRLAALLEASENAQMMTAASEKLVQNWVDRLLAVLRRRAGRHLAEAELEAGASPGYLRKAQSASGNVMLRKFLHICKAAEIDPADVFAEVFPKTDYDSDLGLVIPNRPLPKIAKLALLRFEQPVDFPVVDAGWLDWLDELRYDDPKRAAKVAEAAVLSVREEHLSWLLGIWASACRPLCRHDEAFLVIREALRIARKEEDRLAEADLLLRGASLVSSISGNYSTALRTVERASALFVGSGDFNGLSRSLVKQGMFLYYQGKRMDARKALDCALGLMADSNRRDRVFAYQLLGVLARDEQQPELALTHTAEAMAIASTGYEVGKLQWQKGCILGELSDWDQSDQAFKIALEELIEITPVEAALSVCDHVRLLVSKGRVAEARRRAGKMRRLMGALSDNLIASSAIRDLIRSEEEGFRLTTSLVVRIMKRIEGSRRAGARRPN